METGIQRNRWTDGSTDQWTDGPNGMTNIWQIDRQMNSIQNQMDIQRYRLRMDCMNQSDGQIDEKRLIDRQTYENKTNRNIHITHYT